MQIFTPLRSSIEKLSTHVRSLRLWVLELVAWWVLHCGDRTDRIGMQRDIRAARREVRELIFLTMVSRMTFQRRARKWMRPPSACSGFRYVQRRLNLIRLYTRGVRLRTLRDIRDVLDDFERIVERAIKRVPKGVCTGRLAIVAAPWRRAFAAIAPAAEGADTS
ncbi:MAG: hypothetical protein IV086_15070 [Hyphomonadaceae bacterium]|nr:hypothetical protein [Hyphomonadaceae bacterium]